MHVHVCDVHACVRGVDMTLRHVTLPRGAGWRLTPARGPGSPDAGGSAQARGEARARHCDRRRRALTGPQGPPAKTVRCVRKSGSHGCYNAKEVARHREGTQRRVGAAGVPQDPCAL